jgi:hypothetical protein
LLAKALEDGRDIGVGTGRVAVLRVAGDTIVRPETVNCPGVGRARRRVCTTTLIASLSMMDSQAYRHPRTGPEGVGRSPRNSMCQRRPMCSCRTPAQCLSSRTRPAAGRPGAQARCRTPTQESQCQARRRRVSSGPASSTIREDGSRAINAARHRALSTGSTIRIRPSIYGVRE